MSVNSITQRDITNNQSTLDIQFDIIFINDNWFEPAVYLNNTGGDFDVVTGLLVVRDPATPGQVIPATALNLADVIGVAAMDSNVLQLPDTETAQMNFCNSGGIDERFLVLPAAVTLDDLVGTRSLRDVLNSLGLHLSVSVDNTKFDN